MKFNDPKVLVFILLTLLCTSAFGEISKPTEWNFNLTENNESYTWGIYGLFSNEDTFTLEGGVLLQLLYTNSYGLFFDIGGYYSKNTQKTTLVKKEMPSFIGFLGAKIGVLCVIPIDEYLAFTLRMQSVIIPQLIFNQPASISTSFLRWGFTPGLIVDINENLCLGVEIRESGANFKSSFWLTLNFDS